MKTRLCFFCEKEVPEKEVMCYGGPFALRHFCTCAECFTKHRVLHWDAEPPVTGFGTFLELARRIVNLCEYNAIDVYSPPEEPMAINDLLEWIGEVVRENFQNRSEIDDSPKVDGLGRRAVPLSKILKERESHLGQLSISLPPKGARVLGRFGDGTEYFEVDPDELP